MAPEGTVKILEWCTMKKNTEKKGLPAFVVYFYCYYYSIRIFLKYTVIPRKNLAAQKYIHLLFLQHHCILNYPKTYKSSFKLQLIKLF